MIDLLSAGQGMRSQFDGFEGSNDVCGQKFEMRTDLVDQAKSAGWLRVGSVGSQRWAGCFPAFSNKMQWHLCGQIDAG
jgi:hypothetical protein